MRRSRRPAPPAAGLLRKRLAVPTEHGAWSWWLGPLIVGTAAARAFPVAEAAVVLLATSAFLAHQPATVAVKAAARRAPRTDLAPALVWTAGYGLLAAAGLAWLLAGGHRVVLLPVAAGLVLFPLHLWLVARRAERRQLLFQLAGAVGLALWAPAAYVVGRGEAQAEGGAAVLLWALLALHSAGAVLTVGLRLGWRGRAAPPPLPERLERAAPTLLLHAAALTLAAWSLPRAPFPFGVLAFVLVLADAWLAALRPRPRAMPRRLGFRQLAVTTVFVVLLALQFAV